MKKIVVWVFNEIPLPHNLLFCCGIGKYPERVGLWKLLRRPFTQWPEAAFMITGFGFHRYATDRRWLFPILKRPFMITPSWLFLYVEAYQATGEEEYRRVGREIFTYIQRKMTSQKAFLPPKMLIRRARRNFTCGRPGRSKKY